VALVRTDVSEESVVSIMGVKRISELGTLAHGVAPRKKIFFIVTAAKVSNLPYKKSILTYNEA
jgi:hypothetical protein